MKGERTAPDPAARRRPWLPVALLVGVTMLAYLPSLANGFIWDDTISLTQNPYIRSANGLGQFWFSTRTTDYWPVTATTLWAEWRLWGLNPLGYHATNLALHVGEVLLLWAILRRLRVPGAELAALLFAVHPVNVETVAWITQRKNLMAMLFYLLSILGFLRAEEGSRTAYGLSLAAFVLALLSKGSVAILPVVLTGIVLCRRPLGVREVLRLLPFYVVAGILTLVDIWFQGHLLAAGAVLRHAGGLERLLGAAAAVWFYLGKALLPIRLVLPYASWRIDPGNLLWWLPLAAALALTAFLVGKRRSGPLAGGALLAWVYFGVALFPVMGFTDVYFMKYSLVADHYQHLALIGVTALAGAGWAQWRRSAPGLMPVAAAAGVVAILAGLTWRQCRNYRDPETFFSATVRVNPGSALAQGELGMLLAGQRRNGEAKAHLEEALRLDPDYAEAHTNLGALLIGEGRYAEGEAQYREALRLKPDLFVVHLNLGSLLLRQGRLEEARRELAEVVRLKPSFAEAHAMLGETLARLQRPAEAVGEYEEALRLKPDDPAVRAQLERARAAAAPSADSFRP